MRKLIYFFFIHMSIFSLYANNVVVENIALTGQNTTSNYTMVQFDISWDNSWRDLVNWDAAWVFVKFQGSDGLWRHARLGLNEPDHSAPTGSVIKPANYQDSFAPGVFIYRDFSGAGSNDWNNAQLRWNYGQNGLGDGDLVKIKVFAIEMVYVPQASFQLGDDSEGSSTYHFYRWDNAFPPNHDYWVNSQGAINIGTGTVGYLWANGNQQIEAGTSDADFPTGYNAFYCMKYEITQEQYVDFLNTLTRTQQNTRTSSNISGTSIPAYYVMRNDDYVEYRNGIRCDATQPETGPITIYCDYDGDGIPNEDNDGKNIACNYLSWMDGCAYADWAGLRPMTELEFEKACRGDQPAIAGEYAWGNVNVYTNDYTLTNDGYFNEAISGQPTGTGNASHDATVYTNIVGPLRVGIFALTSTTRQESGASYYGIMELSGNLLERTVTIGNSDGRAFTGNHGDGELSANGNANYTVSWPGWDGSEVTGASGSGRRGGDWASAYTNTRVSYRVGAAYTASGHYNEYGFRCVRSAP